MRRADRERRTAPVPAERPVTLIVNGVRRLVHIPPNRTLLDVLRDTLGLTGTNRGCNQGDCGACTVLLDGASVNACLVLAVDADGSDVTTIEGLVSTASCTRCSARSWTRAPCSAATARRG